jgi:putative flippase GtrA
VQVNFLLSQFFTWHDRWSRALRPTTLVARLLMFNASASSTGLVNQSVFAFANLFTSYIVAAAFGIGVAAVLNFTLNDRLVFRKSTLKPA